MLLKLFCLPITFCQRRYVAFLQFVLFLLLLVIISRLIVVYCNSVAIILAEDNGVMILQTFIGVEIRTPERLLHFHYVWL